jgi:hypothetical protein
MRSHGKHTDKFPEAEEVLASIGEHQELKFAGEMSGKIISNMQNRLQLALDM